MQKTEIEKFSDRSKLNSTLKRDSLAQILQLTSRNFPEELVEGLQSKIICLFTAIISFWGHSMYTDILLLNFRFQRKVADQRKTSMAVRFVGKTVFLSTHSMPVLFLLVISPVDGFLSVYY